MSEADRRMGVSDRIEALRIFQNRPDLDELRDQRPQAAVCGQSLERERHRHPRARALARHRVVSDMEIRVWVVARRGKGEFGGELAVGIGPVGLGGEVRRPLLSLA
jgi:hypothetical protein